MNNDFNSKLLKVGLPSAIHSAPFPPKITSDELMANSLEKLKKTGKIGKVPNAFMAYRMALKKEIAEMGFRPTMSELSSLAGNLWERELEHVKNAYSAIAQDAKVRFEKEWYIKEIQIYQFESSIGHISQEFETNAMPEPGANSLQEIHFFENSNEDPMANSSKPSLPLLTNSSDFNDQELMTIGHSNTTERNNETSTMIPLYAQGIPAAVRQDNCFMGQGISGIVSQEDLVYLTNFDSRLILLETMVIKLLSERNYTLSAVLPIDDIDRIAFLEQLVAVLYAEPQQQQQQQQEH
ncbi:hypothetical protein G9A89_001008 [Geosiphon pyriformis]|nr:hypothetical protein G9A89_001008 [Geosiphon pyriformis]